MAPVHWMKLRRHPPVNDIPAMPQCTIERSNQFILEKLMPKCDFGATKLKQCFPRAKIKQKLCAVCLCLFVFLVFLCLTGQGSNQLAGFEVEMECGLVSPEVLRPRPFFLRKASVGAAKGRPKGCLYRGCKMGKLCQDSFFLLFPFFFLLFFPDTRVPAK